MYPKKPKASSMKPISSTNMLVKTMLLISKTSVSSSGLREKRDKREFKRKNRRKRGENGRENFKISFFIFAEVSFSWSLCQYWGIINQVQSCSQAHSIKWDQQHQYITADLLIVHSTIQQRFKWARAVNAFMRNAANLSSARCNMWPYPQLDLSSCDSDSRKQCRCKYSH